MKNKIFLIALALLTLAACKQDKGKDQNTEETQSEVTSVESDHSANKDWKDEIMLNDGHKWPANKETTDGVQAMLSVIQEGNLVTLENYTVLAASLNDLKNTVVKECTMTGAAHDNLHLWLYPLIEKITHLQQAKNVDEGAQLTSEIKEHLEGYYTYFN